MAEVLVVVETTKDVSQVSVKKVTLEMLTLARDLGEPSAVVLGGSAAPLVDRLAEFGARKVYVAEHPDLDGFLVAPKASVLAALIQRMSPAAVLLASTQEG